MEVHSANWAEVYNSLQIEAKKTSGKWMFIATLVAGLLIVGILSLVFRKYPVVIVIMAIGALSYSGKYALGVWRLSKNPKVCSGIVTAKIENSHMQKSTATRYVSHKIRMEVAQSYELTGNGLGEVKKLARKKSKLNCSKETFNALAKGDNLTVVVMPHDNSITWFQVNNKKQDF